MDTNKHENFNHKTRKLHKKCLAAGPTNSYMFCLYIMNYEC